MGDVNVQTPTEAPASEPVPGTPEHDAALAAKYQEANGLKPEGQSEAQPEADPADPPKEPSLKIETDDKSEELIGGKFKTQEELLAAYEELAAKQAAPADEGSNAEGEEAAASAAPISEELFTKAASEFEASGEIGQETREALVKAGIPEQFIDAYQAGVHAQMAAIRAEAHSMVGGEDNWNAMMEWAKTLPEKDINAFNKAVEDPSTYSLAIQGLYARYTAANGSERPSAIEGAKHGTLNGDVYRSKSEMTADMSDPRYGKDADFTKAVEAKVKRSRLAGTLGPFGVAY